MPAKESTIERNICEYAKKNGCLVFKFTSPGHRGVPDRMIIKDGQVLFLEVKREGQYPTLLQMKCIYQLREQGIDAEWTDSVDKGKALVTKFLLA